MEDTKKFFVTKGKLRAQKINNEKPSSHGPARKARTTVKKPPARGYKIKNRYRIAKTYSEQVMLVGCDTITMSRTCYIFIISAKA